MGEEADEEGGVCETRRSFSHSVSRFANLGCELLWGVVRWNYARCVRFDIVRVHQVFRPELSLDAAHISRSQPLIHLHLRISPSENPFGRLEVRYVKWNATSPGQLAGGHSTILLGKALSSSVHRVVRLECDL